jgi:hypothetical protein
MDHSNSMRKILLILSVISAPLLSAATLDLGTIVVPSIQFQAWNGYSTREDFTAADTAPSVNADLFNYTGVTIRISAPTGMQFAVDGTNPLGFAAAFYLGAPGWGATAGSGYKSFSSVSVSFDGVTATPPAYVVDRDTGAGYEPAGGYGPGRRVHGLAPCAPVKNRRAG